MYVCACVMYLSMCVLVCQNQMPISGDFFNFFLYDFFDRESLSETTVLKIGYPGWALAG